MQSNSNALKKWSWRLLWLTGGLVSIWVLAWATVPWVIKSQLQKGVSDQLGRKATIGEIDFKPWTLELTINDLAIASQDGASAQFTLKRLYANAEIESLLRLAPVLQTLVVEGPRLKLARTGNGTYDIDDILARLAKREPAGTNNPLRFALFNLSLSGGTLDFDDKPVSRVHQLRDLSLSVPFLSNLESRREIKVEPRLAFSFNGSRFDSSAQATPFLPSQKTDAIINLRNFDLAPYLPYIPSGVPLRLQRAMLGADLKLAFEQSGKPVVKLSGVVQVSGVKVADANTRELLAFDGLKLTLDDLRPLDRVAKIAGIELTAPSFTVQRDEAGRINWQLGSGHAENVVAATPATPASATVPALASSDWKVEVARFVVRDGTANWSDAAITPKANLQARELSLDATGIAWPLAQPVEFRGTFAVSEKASTALAAATDSKPAKGRLAASPSSGADAHLIFSGTATDQQATVKASLQSASLALASPYLALFLEPAMHGKLNAELELNWKAPELQLDIQSLTLDDLALVGAAQQGKPVNADKAALASIRKISVSQARIDLAERTVSVGKLAVDQPRFAVVRGQDNHWMFERWLKAPALGSEMAAPSATSAVATKAMAAKKPMAARPGKSMAAAAAPAPWSVVIGDLALDGGVVTYLDQASSKPVALEISALKVLMKDAKLDGNRPSRVQVSGRIAAERGQPGQFDYRGTLQMQPMVVQGNLVARRIPLHGFEPYFGAGLDIELLRADASFKGDLRYAQLPGGPSVKVSGDSALEDFRANSIAANDGGLKIAEELLNWKALNLRGLDLALSPGSPTMIAVKETTLSDFFARVIIHEDGRINLQDIVKADTPPDAAAPAIAASAPAGTPTPAPGARIAAGQGANATSPGAPEPVIDIGPISLINGKVLFSDRFVKPNYSANLSELTGKLSAFSSVVPQGQPRLADLELRGRAEGTASLEILGKLNPLAKPLALDIKGKVRDLELSPLSPYSVKYAGYGITRGKLSVDVAYLVLPDGQLTASNKLVLNQLTFGDKVEGAPNSLPVKLAVALLADRNGVIDIDLPVSGSLNDPQFRLGPIIFKVIVNLIVKAITAPFSLLASAFGGGGDELSVVGFAPGSAVLSQPAKDGLDKVAKALAERPALKMTVVGTSSLGAERDAYKHERLLALLKAEKRRVLVTVGSAQDAAAPLEVSDADIPALLKEVYQRADMPKPPNALGVAKEVTPQEMEALLMANITATEEAMRELALLRGVVVRDYLASRQLAVERLFLGAVKTVAEDPKWSPRAELSLANN